MRKIWRYTAVILLFAAIVCGGLAVKTKIEKERTNARYQQMRQTIRLEETWEEEKTVQDMETEEDTEKELVIPVDFEALKKINAEIYAWITIPGTVIDYPVVQSEKDDAKYLTLTAEEEESAAGSIFSESKNAKDFSDVHTVLYGHNMKDGTMFAGLHKFEEEEFFNAHRTVVIYTPDAIRYYRIFAAYLYDDRHLLQSFDCSDAEVFEAYIKSIMEQRNLYAYIDRKAKIRVSDRILTLSTCHSMGPEYRYLVQAVLAKEIK